MNHIAIDSDENTRFVKILERISEQSTSRHVKDIENITGAKLRFTLPKYDSGGVGQQFQEYLPNEIAGDGFMLPVFLLTDVKIILNNILPRKEEYPFSFAFSADSIAKSKTFIHDCRHLSIVPAILDLSIEKFIYTEAAKEIGLNYTGELGYNKYSISNILKKEKIDTEHLYISLKDRIIEYQKVINTIIQPEDWSHAHDEYELKKNLINVDSLNWEAIFNDNKFKIYYRIDEQVYQNSINIYTKQIQELPVDNLAHDITLANN
nr:hypothetical protein [uncultured Kingella sp.]